MEPWSTRIRNSNGGGGYRAGSPSERRRSLTHVENGLGISAPRSATLGGGRALLELDVRVRTDKRDGGCRGGKHLGEDAGRSG